MRERERQRERREQASKRASEQASKREKVRARGSIYSACVHHLDVPSSEHANTHYIYTYTHTDKQTKTKTQTQTHTDNHHLDVRVEHTLEELVECRTEKDYDNYVSR
jgi:hypothetical protein